MTGRDFEFDYKAEWVKKERRKQENSVVNWIYIGVDSRFNNMAKIGLTTGGLGTRASGSQNPFYALLCAFKIKEGVDYIVVSQIENSVIAMLSRFYKRIPHNTTRRFSEWFYAAPEEMREVVYDYLCDNYLRFMYCYYCSDRDMDVIYSWENRQLLYGEARNPYQAGDLSSPPLDFRCFMPGGCGADCDCWN